MQTIKKMAKRVAAISVGAAFLGATITGALAADLGNYPNPFVDTTNKKFDYLLVLGDDGKPIDTIGATDIASGLASVPVASSGGTSISVSGGKTEDIPLGAGIAGTESWNFDQELEDDDISSLLDTAVNFQSSEYDVREAVVLSQTGKGFNVSTSLTASEDDYETDVYFEVDRDAIKYYYVFDETIQPNLSTSSQPLEIKFLGKTLKLTSISTTANNKFSAYVGTEFYMNVGDEVTVEGKKVNLNNVGSGGAISITVDGVQETIPASSTETVNGIEITNDETFYDSNDVSQRSATLIIGEDSQETYTDGDAYVGEDDNDPDWVWNIDNLNSKLSTTSTATAEFSGPYLGIENDFDWDAKNDGPAGLGECIDLSNNYVSICLDSLTVADDNYMEYVFEYESKSDFSDAFVSNTSVPALYMHTTQDEGFIIDYEQLDWANMTSDAKTKEIWLYYDNVTVGCLDDLEVFYKDASTSKIRLAGTIKTGDATPEFFAHISYDNTKDDDIKMYVLGNASSYLNLTLQPYHSTNLPNYNDNITMMWGMSSNKFNSLGASASSEEAGELLWNNVNIGSKDEDHRTRYGVIIQNPKGSGASDKVKLKISGDQVQANVVLKGTSATVISGGGSVISAVDTAPSNVLASEVADKTAYNIITVGGPAVNKVSAELMGLTYPTYGEASGLKEGEAVIELKTNGAKVAMIVAGWEGEDTRRASRVLKNYGAYSGKLTGSSVTVTGTTASPTIVSA